MFLIDVFIIISFADIADGKCQAEWLLSEPNLLLCMEIPYNDDWLRNRK